MLKDAQPIEGQEACDHIVKGRLYFVIFSTGEREVFLKWRGRKHDESKPMKIAPSKMGGNTLMVRSEGQVRGPAHL